MPNDRQRVALAGVAHDLDGIAERHQAGAVEQVVADQFAQIGFRRVAGFEFAITEHGQHGVHRRRAALPRQGEIAEQRTLIGSVKSLGVSLAAGHRQPFLVRPASDRAPRARRQAWRRADWLGFWRARS